MQFNCFCLRKFSCEKYLDTECSFIWACHMSLILVFTKAQKKLNKTEKRLQNNWLTFPTRHKILEQLSLIKVSSLIQSIWKNMYITQTLFLNMQLITQTLFLNMQHGVSRISPAPIVWLLWRSHRFNYLTYYSVALVKLQSRV